MRICFTLLYYDHRLAGADVRAYLAAIRTAHDLPRALAERGHEVDVVHLFPGDAELRLDGVDHHFVAPGALARLTGAAFSPRRARRAWRTPAGRAVELVARLRPDVVHFFGTTLHLNLALLSRRMRRLGRPVVLHYHGGGAASGVVARRLQRYGFGAAARLLFTTVAQADEHARVGLIDDGRRRVVEMVETSTRMAAGDRGAARRRTGMGGDPVFVWAARLQRIKDPLTALRGFARVAAVWREAQLYLYYLEDDLLPEMRSWVERHPEVAEQVHFRGRVPYADMEPVFNSADFLLQSSLREHSGCAVLDAMACGVVPVVSDIPSFRAMTGDGAAGVLFAPGDAEALARGVLAVRREDIDRLSAAVRTRFDENLSFAALGRRLESIYSEVVDAGPAGAPVEAGG